MPINFGESLGAGLEGAVGGLPGMGIGLATSILGDLLGFGPPSEEELASLRSKGDAASSARNVQQALSLKSIFDPGFPLENLKKGLAQQNVHQNMGVSFAKPGSGAIGFKNLGPSQSQVGRNPLLDKVVSALADPGTFGLNENDSGGFTFTPPQMGNFASLDKKGNVINTGLQGRSFGPSPVAPPGTPGNLNDELSRFYGQA